MIEVTVSERENERQYRMIDQRLSSHAMLRGRYGCRALWLSISLLSVAVTVNAFVVDGADILVTVFGVSAETMRTCLGTASVAVMILSIVGLRVDWSSAKQAHGDAVRRLTQLKAQFRRSHDEATGGVRPTDELERLTCEYNRVMGDLLPIPEKQFAKLKAAHAFKRLVSEEISAHPGVPAVLVSIGLRFRAIWQLCAKGHFRDGRNVESE